MPQGQVVLTLQWSTPMFGYDVSTSCILQLTDGTCCVIAYSGTYQEWKLAFHGLWDSAGLKMPSNTHFFRQAIVTHKVGYINLVFGVQSCFISWSMHTWLQVSVCSSYDLCHRS